VRPEPPQATAAALYALEIRSRRDLLETLYYATKNGADEAWELHRRLQALKNRKDTGTPELDVGDVLVQQDLINSARAAEATAMDSASTLVLILDKILQRLGLRIGDLDTRDLGPDIEQGIKLNRAIWALANQARHLHKWVTRADAELHAQKDVKTIVALRHDPRNENAARELLCGMHLNSYLALEDKMIETAREVLATTGWSLTLLSAGSYRLSPPPLHASP
jgi:hypothetical protein